MSIAAAALAAQLLTGAGLADLCAAPRHDFCTTFILETVVSDVELGCVPITDPDLLRRNYLTAISRGWVDPSRPARVTVRDALSLMCGGN